MNKGLKITAIIGLGAMLIGATTMGIGYFGNHQKINNITLDKGFKIQKMTTKSNYAIKSFQSLKIDVKNVDLDIVQGSTLKLKTTLDQNEKVKLTQTGDELQMTVRSERDNENGFVINTEQRHITLTIPKEMTVRQLAINSNASAIMIQKLSVLENTDINQHDSGLILDDVTFNHATINNTQAGTRVEGGQFTDSNFVNQDGPFRSIGGHFLGNSKIEASNDDINLSGLNSDLMITADNRDGEIKLSGIQSENTTRSTQDGKMQQHTTFGASDQNKLQITNSEGNVTISNLSES
ncbi:DUF4097 family beta strand repeat protein [Weissella diestrammenae]|uniref:DUF4097 family beta strand repeat protein n=1 Tax=Weissella diestrammenae TaxID=1162633 RepID=A0A7G9T4D3_9LACO|nr:DUF4097 family beta strand repeat-containing protein [Weissella diestrammenae]MCM0583494.1 DUF4097 family beta strand repeat protein [Weissella diestrammenae]QNN74958.1 DUF4097 family beta strand repeat protein [Weissella diestrammenae]